MGDAKSSVSILKKLIERGYRNPAVYEIMSRAHLHLGHRKEAILDAIACTELCPEWSKAFCALGFANLSSGNIAAAKSAFARGLELDCSSQEIQNGLRLCQDQNCIASSTESLDACRRWAIHHGE
eukprot:jgi/Picsp_1/3028/NSC_01250-R1_tpr-repeat protein